MYYPNIQTKKQTVLVHTFVVQLCKSVGFQHWALQNIFQVFKRFFFYIYTSVAKSVQIYISAIL